MTCMTLLGSPSRDLSWDGWTLASAGPPLDGTRCRARIRDSSGLSGSEVVEVEATYSLIHGGFINRAGERFIDNRPILAWRAVHPRRPPTRC